jgi:CubicO group peptidase (beta-lactamase class C family)
VLRLVEAGRIGLDEPVPGHLRRWRLPPSPFDADGITVRRLLSYTAGLSVHGYVARRQLRQRC